MDVLSGGEKQRIAVWFYLLYIFCEIVHKVQKEEVQKAHKCSLKNTNTYTNCHSGH